MLHPGKENRNRTETNFNMLVINIKKNVMNHADFQKLCGKPLNHIPKPKIPLGNKEYYLAIAVVCFFAVYGGLFIKDTVSRYFYGKD